MKSLVLAVVSLLTIYSINCEVYFEEKFPDGMYLIYVYLISNKIVLYNRGRPHRFAACTIDYARHLSPAYFWCALQKYCVSSNDMCSYCRFMGIQLGL